jgi:hypothetical protein
VTTLSFGVYVAVRLVEVVARRATLASPAGPPDPEPT